jgi:hypothetical protein
MICLRSLLRIYEKISNPKKLKTKKFCRKKMPSTSSFLLAGFWLIFLRTKLTSRSFESLRLLAKGP